jgi:hypothetical protein
MIYPTRGECVRVMAKVLNATFNNILVIPWGQFHRWRKPEYPIKNTDQSQITDTCYHIMLYRVLLDSIEMRTHNASGHCIDSGKFN